MKRSLAWGIGFVGLAGVGGLWATYEPSQPQSASFTSEYKQQSRGRVQFEIPEVYELVNICIFLGRYDGNGHQARFQGTAYGREVLAWFGKYRDHACIQAFGERVRTINNNYAVREPSYSYSFEASGRLQQTGPYRGLVSYEQKLLPSLLPELEAFARVSGFRKFYAEHAEFYARQKKVFEKLAEVESMHKWLEAKFPERVSSYRIICSPLTGGNHRTSRGRDGDFLEILMFVSSPPYQKSFTRLDQSELMRMVFTEIDHNYVNPSTVRVGGVEQAMGDWQKWGGGQTSYRGAEMVWNEYMTWGLFTLFCHDHFGGQVGIADMVRGMERRGFGRFGGFNSELLRFYRSSPKASGDEMTAHMMAWCAGQG